MSGKADKLKITPFLSFKLTYVSFWLFKEKLYNHNVDKITISTFLSLTPFP